jgi:two-component system, OmpR family, sensor histidine kinase KdpD
VNGAPPRFGLSSGRVALKRGGAQGILLRGDRPPLMAGFLATIVLVAVCTALIYPLKQLTTVSSLGVVYLLGVVVIATFWGRSLGLVMAVLSAAAFNFFHLPPVGRFTIADSRNWVALGTFLVAASVSSWVSEVARRRAVESERRRAEADLTAEMSQLMLGGEIRDGLALIGSRVAAVFDLPWATMTQQEVPADARHETIAVRAGGRMLGTLIIPAGQPAGAVTRLSERVVPALGALLAVALERDRLVAERVQTEGLRRSEAVKTAVLRAVSHDLRSPVTAMMAAGATVRAAPELSFAEREELGGLVVQEGARLSKLIADLLDLSRLEARAAAPELGECAVDELIDSALATQPADAAVEVSIDPNVPLIQADFAQIERALANLLENAIRFSAGEPVMIRARVVGRWVSIRVVDRGPGLAAGDGDRIFEPFYRGVGRGSDTHAGSGLGLAIAKGFIEANGGRIWVESTPGRGTTFSVSLVAAPTEVS